MNVGEVYSINFEHELPKGIPSTFKHALAEVAYTIELKIGSLRMEKEVLVVRAKGRANKFYSPIHGKK